MWSFSFSNLELDTNMGKYEFWTPSFLISLLKNSWMASQIEYDWGRRM